MSLNLLFQNAKLAAEVFAVFGILLVFWRHPSIKMIVDKKWTLVLLASLFIIQAVAQVTTRKQYQYLQTHEPFPFTRWAMFAGFTSPANSTIVYDWRGIDTDGQPVSINPAHLFITPNAVVLFTKTHALGDQISIGKSPPRSTIVALNAFAQGLLIRHNHLNPQREITCIELWRRTVPLTQGATIPNPFFAPQSVRIHIWPNKTP